MKHIQAILCALCFLSILHPISLQAQTSDEIASLENLSEQEEKDNILALVAMTYVLQDWQMGDYPPRGYNIGALLYDPATQAILGMNRNSIYRKDDKTQHAEVGLMQNYFQKVYDKNPRKTLKGLQIITTLEPCMMCSGMMVFLEVDTVKYIQTDPSYGKNIERLAQDWVDSTGVRHPANQRCTRIRSISLQETCFASEMLDKGYELYGKNKSEKSLAEFLKTKRAFEIYRKADTLIRNWKLIYPANRTLLQNAHKALHIPRTGGPLKGRKRGQAAAESNYQTFLDLYNSIQ